MQPRRHEDTKLMTLVPIMILFLALQAASQTQTHPRLQLQTCRPEGVQEDLQCGKYTVFEDRVKKSGRTIDLNLVVLPALDPAHKSDPLFDLAGTEVAELYAGEIKPYRQNRDVVLVDQRGTGKSNPLNCRLLSTGPQSYLADYYSPEYVKTCASELAQHSAPQFYLTSIAMDDLDEIRDALGYDKIFLSGASYYSRAAQEYIRRHGEHVRGAILRSVVPMDAKIPSLHATSAQRALDTLFDDCFTDSACNSAYPKLRKEWKDLLGKLKDKPAIVKYHDAELKIRREIFTELIRTQLYSPAQSRKLPYMIHQAAQGDFTPFLDAAIPKEAKDLNENWDGMFLTTMCSEAADFIDSKQALSLSSKTDFGSYRYLQQQQACGLWPHPSLPADILQPVTSDVPVLIIEGNKDPVTPPAFGEQVSATLPNSRVVVIPESGHTSSGLGNRDCLVKIDIEFLNTTNTRDLNTSCVSGMLPPPFQVPSK